jgi:mycofactocin glycosyltransferase
VRVLDGGRVLVGGSPMRLVSLTTDGARVVAGWQSPSPVGRPASVRRLGRRLLDAGILMPQPLPEPSTSDLTVVVPVRDRPAALERCLNAVVEACADSPVVVVDDGSIAPVTAPAARGRGEVRVIRHPVARGPAAARNSGLAACSSPYVGFVDSDVVVPAGAAGRLLGHFSDPCVAAVAPRVRALTRGPGLIGGYEERHSALDMGPAGGLVAPGRSPSYVPGTVLLVRRSAIGDGFDESLTIGEDVDLVWRMCRAGWRVRYAPEVEVWHEQRTRLRDFVARRYLYARSTGRLARRHPDALPAMRASPMLALPWILVLSGRRRAALIVTAGAFARTGWRLRTLPASRLGLSGALVVRGLGAAGLALAQAARRAWAPPLLLLAIGSPAARAVLLAAFAIPFLVRGRAGGDLRATVGDLPIADLRATLGDLPIGLLEEALASVATWEGCLRERTIRPLLPSWRSPDSVTT